MQTYILFSSLLYSVNITLNQSPTFQLTPLSGAKPPPLPCKIFFRTQWKHTLFLSPYLSLFLCVSLSLSKLNLNQCQCQESSVNIQVSAQGLPGQTAQGPQPQLQPAHSPTSLKDHNNPFFVGQWLMTYRYFIHDRFMFWGYRDNQVKTEHIGGIEFPNLDHWGRGKGKKEKQQLRGHCRS